MIRAMIFDLDGTLVNTEELKALAYSRAISQLRGAEISKETVLGAYQQVVGQTRDAASRFLMEQLGLEEICRTLMPQYGVAEPWQVLTAMRVTIYQEMIADPEVLRASQWPHNVGLLRIARTEGCRTALATSSYTHEAHQVLAALDLEDQFDVVIGVDQVQHPKPDPEIYLLAAERLAVPPEECMVIEDSPPGVRAGLAAGMNVIAVATPFTVDRLHAAGQISHQWVVHEPDRLLEVVEDRVREHNRTVHRREEA
ncbi:MAG TPA: HAD family phosphatase [Dehalococcoidia bacterium]|nr:HAD family phosphatase [Dehalococcoidia bacterium]